jgi:hypothetical protein
MTAEMRGVGSLVHAPKRAQRSPVLEPVIGGHRELSLDGHADG